MDGIHGGKIRRMFSSFRCRVADRLLLRRIVVVAEACWILVVVVQAGAVADVRVDIRIGGNGVVAVQPSPRAEKVRKLVAGSEHGVRRQRGFRFGGGQQSLRF
jgi:hypothetical protein